MNPSESPCDLQKALPFLAIMGNYLAILGPEQIALRSEAIFPGSNQFQTSKIIPLMKFEGTRNKCGKKMLKES